MGSSHRETDSKREKYGSARKRAEEGSSERTAIKQPEGLKFFKFNQSVSRLDILPYVAGKGNKFAEPGATFYERTYFAHPRIGVNEDMYICPAKTFGKECPICEHRMSLRQNPDSPKDLVKSFEPKERQLFLIVNRDKKADGPMLWDCSYHLFGKQLNAFIDLLEKGDPLENFFHARDGATVTVGAAEESMGGYKFWKANAIQMSPRKDSLDREMLKGLPCLDDLIIEVSYDKLKKIFGQVRSGSSTSGSPSNPSGSPVGASASPSGSPASPSGSPSGSPAPASSKKHRTRSTKPAASPSGSPSGSPASPSGSPSGSPAPAKSHKSSRSKPKASPSGSPSGSPSVPF